MLFFSKKEDYAFVLVGELVKNYKKRLVPVSEIAREYNISPFFLRNLANTLKKNGIIGAVEGIKGGYYLLNSPKKIKVKDILNSFPSRAFFDCCDFKCPREAKCPSSSSWKRINKEFLDKINNLSLAEFINEK